MPGPRPTASRSSIEIDRSRNRVRASASGATALVEGANAAAGASEAERIEAARRALRVDASAARVLAQTAGFIAVAAGAAVAVVDERAVVRLILPRASVAATTAGRLEGAIAAAIDEHTTYGDVGRALPDLWLLAGARIVELSGLSEARGAAALANDDVVGLPADAVVAIVAVAKRA